MSEKGEPTWMPWSDIVNLGSMALIAIGVFVLPILRLVDLDTVKYSFGLAVLLSAGYPFALAGHYNLFKKGERGGKGKRGGEEKQTYCPCQEKFALSIIGALTIVYVILWIIG